MKQLSILTPNKPGVLAAVTTALGRNGINLESISAQTFPEGAVIKLLTKDFTSAKKSLEQNGYNVSTSDVLLLEMDDKSGELSKFARKFAGAGINIETIYLMSRNNGKVVLAITSDNNLLAKKIFRKNILK